MSCIISAYFQGCSQLLKFQGGQIHLGGVKSVILYIKFKRKIYSGPPVPLESMAAYFLSKSVA